LRRAPRDARIARALRQVEESLRGEPGIVALQRDLAEQQVVERRFVEVGGGGLRAERQGHAERQTGGQENCGNELGGIDHLTTTHLRYIWCPAQDAGSNAAPFRQSFKCLSFL